MGHTVWSQRMVLDHIMNELKQYSKALRQDDRALFEKILKQSFKHYGSISYANSFHAWALLLLSILIEQEKKIQKLEVKNEGLVNGCV